MNRQIIVLTLTMAFLATTTTLGWAQESEPELPDEAICTVCARRGAGHGPEKVAAWRTYQGEHYAFCSKPCAEAFDQMPEGYAPPVLPRPAPTVALRTITGEPVQWGGGDATLVDFWATWCAPCLEMMPTLSRLHAERSGDGFRVVGISIDEDRGKLERFLKKRGPAYPIVHDVGEDPAWWAFRVPAIPAAFLLDGEGRIVAQWSTDFSEKALLDALASLSEPSEGRSDADEGR